MSRRIYTFRLTEMEAKVAGDALSAALAGPTGETSDYGWSEAEEKAAIRAMNKFDITKTPEFVKGSN